MNDNANENKTEHTLTNSAFKRKKFSLNFNSTVVNWVLLALTLLCFGFFITGSFFMHKWSGLNTPVAVLLHGQVHKKVSGSTEFTPVEPGTSFQNMDVVWVDKDHRAILELYDGSQLKLTERTLVILKRAFKRKFNFEPIKPSESIFVIRGNVAFKFDIKHEIEEIRKIEVELVKRGEQKKKVEEIQKKKIDENKDHVDIKELGASQKGDKDDSADKIQPVPNAIIYYLENKPTVSIGFFWGKLQTGTLVVRSTKSGDLKNIAINNIDHHNLDLKQNESYEWRLVDAAQNPILGPYIFDTRVAKGKEIDEVVGASISGKTDRPYIISW